MYESAARLFDLLKASGWQTSMLAVAAGLLLYLSANGFLPVLPDIVLISVWVVLFICAALAAASVGHVLQQAAVSIFGALRVFRAKRAAGNAFREHVPYLTDRERRILGYLREKKQKTFTADHDGGYAGTLIAQGFVQYMGVPGQSFDMDRCPFRVADHVWKIMELQPNDFPYMPEMSSEGRKTEIEPWHIPL